MSKCLQLEYDRVVVGNKEKGAVLPEKVRLSVYVKSGGNEMRPSEFC
jgi:hypothetical protein